MKFHPKWLLFSVLWCLCSPEAFAEETPEETVRQIYQRYSNGSNPIIFDDLSDKSIISARMKQALALDNRFTLPGDSGWLNADPVCDCQDYENLMLEDVTIGQLDATHADAVVRFRPFQESEEIVTLTLKLIAENKRWLIDDVINESGSLYQGLEGNNLKTLAVLKSLQKKQPQEFIHELLSRMGESTWSWTGVVSAEFRQTVTEYQLTRFSFADDDYLALLEAEPICDCEITQFKKIDSITAIENKGDTARIRAHLSFTKGPGKVQDFLLHLYHDQWVIDDFISSEHGSLLQRIREAIRRNKQ